MKNTTMRSIATFSLRQFTGPALLTLGFAVGLPVHAGRPCEEPHLPNKQALEYGLKMAQRTQDSLNRSGADVVILGRAGQDLSAYSLRYSHLGFAYRQTDINGANVWRVVHKLNECGTAESALYRQGLGDFFLDNPWRYEAVAIVPRADVQSQLLAVITDNAQLARIHHKPYNLVSYVWGQKYQQSNQWGIETMAMAMDAGTNDTPYTRSQAQAWLAGKSYQPSTLKIGPLTRLGARIGSANVAFDDHPDEKRYADRIETVTVDSVITWMTRTGYADKIIYISQDLYNAGTPDRVQPVAARQPERVQPGTPMADVQAGNDAFRNKDYTRAYNLLMPRAAAGDREAQFTMGLIFRNGYGRPQNTNEALRWFRLSGDQEYSPAEYNLGSIYASDSTVPRDYNSAIYWLNRARNHGNQGANALLDQVMAQKRAEDLKAAATAPAPAANDNRVVVRPDPQDDVAPCVRAARVQCTTTESEAWTQDFMKNLRQSVRYPQSAILNSRAGEVSLTISVCADDTNPRSSVRVSSGFDDLDAAALQAARRMVVQAPICSGLKAPITLTAPVTFTLDGVKKASSR
jgi:TonB family protein